MQRPRFLPPSLKRQGRSDRLDICYGNRGWERDTQRLFEPVVILFPRDSRAVLYPAQQSMRPHRFTDGGEFSTVLKSAG